MSKIAKEIANEYNLSESALKIIETAIQLFSEGPDCPYMGINHWLLAITEQFDEIVEEIVEGINMDQLRFHLYDELRRHRSGDAFDTGTLLDWVSENFSENSVDQITERELAMVIITETFSSIKEFVQDPDENEDLEPVLDEDIDDEETEDPCQFLNAFCRNLTSLAEVKKLNKVVGRDKEIQLVVETLCRRTKRNPVLIGPAGSGKTAIVEGLAQKIVTGEVPEQFIGISIFEVQPSVLLAGAGNAGELENRINWLIEEASAPDVILFIDEVHTTVGAGGIVGTGDMASLLKPELARGNIACIAATTEEEYLRFIEPDRALERRFQPIRVQELTAGSTVNVMCSVRDELAQLRGVYVPDHVLEWLVSFAGQFLHNRCFPDKAVDLLEQCVAYAVTQDKKEIDQSCAALVAQRMIGMPVDLGQRLDSLKEKLKDFGLMSPGDLNLLLNRLNVTMRGLDIRPRRPNAILLLNGEAVQSSERLAEIFAECLNGAPDRVVTIDFSRLVHQTDVAMLVGAPPGYRGYRESLPIHKVLQIPHCVLRFENIHACHPQVREVIQKMLSDGVLVDSRGKRIYLSDTIVLLTAGVFVDKHRPLGFRASGGNHKRDVRESLEDQFGTDFINQIDFIFTESAHSAEVMRRWLQQNILRELCERFSRAGLDLHFHDSLIDWLVRQKCCSDREWERFVDQRIGSLLVKHLPTKGKNRFFNVKYANEQVVIEESLLKK